MQSHLSMPSFGNVRKLPIWRWILAGAVVLGLLIGGSIYKTMQPHEVAKIPPLIPVATESFKPPVPLAATGEIVGSGVAKPTFSPVAAPTPGKAKAPVKRKAKPAPAKAKAKRQ